MIEVWVLARGTGISLLHKTRCLYNVRTKLVSNCSIFTTVVYFKEEKRKINCMWTFTHCYVDYVSRSVSLFSYKTSRSTSLHVRLSEPIWLYCITQVMKLGLLKSHPTHPENSVSLETSISFLSLILYNSLISSLFYDGIAIRTKK